MKKILLVGYILFLIGLVGFSYLFIDGGLFYLKPLFTNFFQLHRVVTSAIFILCLILFFGFYSIYMLYIKQNKLSRMEIKNVIVLSGAILLFSYPAMLSFDIFNYIATAKVTFFYHENPYIIMPIAFTHDPLLLFMHAANKTALYAPVWILFTGIPYLLGLNNFLLTLCNFKLLVGLFYAGTIVLLYKTTKNYFKTALFALNPLVLIETFVSAHNDIVMMFFLLLFLNALTKKHWAKGIGFFLLSAGIKYVTLILTPLFFLQSLKKPSEKGLITITVLLLYGIFFLSSLREEIYPWYSMWFFLPTVLIAENNLLTWVSVTFTASMLLRYIPFMLLGTYFGPTPLLKVILMWIPIMIAIVVYFVTQKKKKLI